MTKHQVDELLLHSLHKTIPKSIPEQNLKGCLQVLPDPPSLPNRLNVENMVLSAACSCCRPLQLHKEEFQLPCEDPDNPGKRLTKDITVFGGCVCNFDSCIQ